MAESKGEVLAGTLDLIVLKTLDTMGPMHGYGIAQRVQQVSEDLLKLNQGTLYPALLRLEQKGWISSKWGASENNRKAKYYTLSRSGRKQLAHVAENPRLHSHHRAYPCAGHRCQHRDLLDTGSAAFAQASRQPSR